MQDKEVTHRLFDQLKDRFSSREGGYLRIVKKGFRKGDGASISVVQLVSNDKGEATTKN